MAYPYPSPNPENVLLGKGKLLFDRFSGAGAKQGYHHLGNCSTFELSTEDDVIENQNAMIAAGGIYKSVTRARTINVNVTGFEFSTQSLAIALMGEVTSTTQTTGTATLETLSTSLTKGKYYRATKRGITPTLVTCDNGTATATLTATTDYTVFDSDAGIIRIEPTSTNAVNTQTLKMTYTYLTYTSGQLETVYGGASSKIEGTLIYVPDPATGPSWEVTCWKVSFNPNGAVGFITDDFGTWQVTGKVMDDSLGSYGGSVSSPYYTAIQTV